MSREQVARLAGVAVEQVEEAAAYEVRKALADRVPADVLEVATLSPGPASATRYWRSGDRYWLDDPSLGEPAAIDELRYDREVGLYHPRILTEEG